MARRAHTALAPPDTEFNLVLAVCRSAVAAGDDVLRHQVRRLLEFLTSNGAPEKVAALRELLDGSERTRSMSPVRLQRSRASVPGEPLTRSIRPPVDKETAVPLGEILWPDQLPSVAPSLPADLSRALDGLITEWHSAAELARVGVNPTRSALIFGLPGTGKTHLALWLAGQLQLPVVVARLDGLISSFLGTTSRNIGQLFDFAERYQCVLLLDEFDAVAKLRDDPHEMGEIKRVVNTILQRLDQRNRKGNDNWHQPITSSFWTLPCGVALKFRCICQSQTSRLGWPYCRRISSRWSCRPRQLRFQAWLCGEMSGAEIRTFVHSFKRSVALAPEQDTPFVEVCRQVCSLHGERMGAHRTQWLLLPDPAAAKALAKEDGIGLDLVEIGQVFGKGKSTIARWISG